MYIPRSSLNIAFGSGVRRHQHRLFLQRKRRRRFVKYLPKLQEKMNGKGKKTCLEKGRKGKRKENERKIQILIYKNKIEYIYICNIYFFIYLFISFFIEFFRKRRGARRRRRRATWAREASVQAQAANEGLEGLEGLGARLLGLPKWKCKMQHVKSFILHMILHLHYFIFTYFTHLYQFMLCIFKIFLEI